MDFGTDVKTCLSKYATFDGRARRSEFWFFALFQFLLNAAGHIIDVGFLGHPPGGLQPVSGLIALALLLPGLAAAVRRLHDKDYAGWWVLLILVPIIGWIV